jgi:hypothetical protein
MTGTAVILAENWNSVCAMTQFDSFQVRYYHEDRETEQREHDRQEKPVQRPARRCAKAKIPRQAHRRSHAPVFKDWLGQ